MSGAGKDYLAGKISGIPDDAAWSEAQSLNDFSFPWIDRAAPPTEFRALWNGERFFFRFEVVDEEVVLNESDDRLQRVLGSDRVELFFACDAGLAQYYCAEMDPRGEVHDYAARFYRDFDASWRFPGLEFSSELREDGYAIEGSVPMATFRELRIEGVEEGWMRAGVYRAEFSRGKEGAVVQDWISWVDPGTEKADFHVPASFGALRLDD